MQHALLQSVCPGADPEIEEGGAHIEWGVVQPCGACSFFVLRAEHSRGVWGHVPPGKILNLDHMRVLPRPLETQPRKIYGNWTVTQVIHRMVISWSPFPSESAFVYEALPQNCLLGAAVHMTWKFVIQGCPTF